MVTKPHYLLQNLNKIRFQNMMVTVRKSRQAKNPHIELYRIAIFRTYKPL